MSYYRTVIREQYAARKVPGFHGQIQVVEWLSAERIPKAAAAINHEHLGQQAALAVSDDDHSPQGRVPAGGVNLGDGISKCLAQQYCRVRNGIAGVVAEEPELEMLPDLAVTQ